VTALRPRDIASRRLVNQHLVGAGFATAVEVVRRLGAVQAQDYPGAKWGVAIRTPAATDAEVERAVNDGAIVRTHVLRPTWHFVAGRDIRWMLALTAPRVRARMAPYNRHLELDDKVFARSAAAITKALIGGNQLTRAELGAVLRRARIDSGVGQRLAHLMMRAELDGLVCSGAWKGRQSTYALLDERVPPGPALQPDEALAELARRYFATRGPATVQDFAWWSGLSVGDARRGIAMLQPGLEQETIGRRTYWYADESPPARSATTTAHLLPNYDEYFIGFKDRSAIAERVDASSVPVAAGALQPHVIVVDGQLVGGWKRVITGRRVTLKMRIVVGISRRELGAVEGVAERYGRFIGMPVETVVSR
jgi:hypothetical protein